MNRSILCAAALALAGTISAHAGEVSEQRQTVVRYDDINVKQAAGAQVLLARLDRAAETVCGPAPDMRALGAWEAYKSCTKTASNHAVAALPFDLMASLKGNSETAVASR
jgi:UrcA family protein